MDGVGLIIERYVGAAVLKAALMAALVLLVLVEFQLLIDEFEDVGRGDFGTLDAVYLALLRTPRYAYEILPIAALIGSLLGLGSLAAQGEITALRAAGVSVAALVGILLKAGLVLVLVVFVLSDVIAPRAERLAEQIRVEKQSGDQAALRSRHGFWARDGRVFFNIRAVEAGSELGDISVYEFDDERRLQRATHARSARPEGDGWRLVDIRQTEFADRRLESRSVPEARWERLIDPRILDLVVLDPEMLSTLGLHQYIEFLQRSGQSATAYEVEYWNKFAAPVATLVMMFLAVPFALANLRATTTGQRTFVGVLLGAGFYLVSRGFSYAAIVYEFNPALMAFLPSLLFLVLGVSILRRMA